uniref:Uncharacterized protein n=1 Tax=Aegilops tauschii TaxID=37682 RepID=M8B1A7_AEGTA
MSTGDKTDEVKVRSPTRKNRTWDIRHRHLQKCIGIHGGTTRYVEVVPPEEALFAPGVGPMPVRITLASYLIIRSWRQAGSALSSTYRRSLTPRT